MLGLAIQASANVQSIFELRSDQFVDEGHSAFRDGAAASSTSFLLHSDSVQQFKSFSVSWNVETEYAAAENWNYFRPKEVFLSANGFSLGRKKFVWSLWEKRWGQALFQPRFFVDKLHNDDAGLVGLFFEKKYNFLSMRLGFLPIHIPESGPHFYAKNQALVSRNAWFTPPPAQFNYKGVPTDISYMISQPSMGTAIGHPGAVAEVEWKPSEFSFSRFSYAYKPMPQIIMGFPLDHQFMLSSNSMQLQLHPRFLYHHVANFDFGWMHRTGEAGLSLAVEKPIRDKTPATWETQEVTDATIASVYSDWWLDSSHRTTAGLSVLKVWGGDAKDRGDIESTQNLFERRYQYTDAVALSFRRNWLNSKVPNLDAGVRILFDRIQSGFIYSADITARVQRSLSVTAGVDFFGLLIGAAPSTDQFMHVYRGNDRLSMGMNYVF
jgi:hypothetical protein